MSLKNLPLSRLGLEYDPHGRLVLMDGEGGRSIAIVPVRAFPISDPDHWISLCDMEGHEVLAIDDIGQVPTEMRQMLIEELARREFIPVIQRILSATSEEPSLWSVETDRGPTSFQVNSDDDVRRMEPAQASIIDSHGIRYLIPDVRRLDIESLQILDHFV